MEPLDAELIARVLTRDDRHAFAALVRRHQSPVRALLRRLAAGDLALADDLAQETFLRAYRGLRGFQGGSRLSTWLHRIAYRVFLDQRTRARKPAADDAAVPNPPAAPELRHDLEGALSRLPDDERAAIAAVYGGELTHEEAAEVLGCPLGTLKTNVARAKQRLRGWLASWAEAEASARV